jgi:YXWGXW repeat-containing protein
MLVKKILVSALFAAGMIGAVATPLPSVAAVDIQLNFGPPADRHEVVPPPRRGYVWAPGHWQWNAGRNRHIWAAGYWERARPGYVFQRPQWVERDGRWTYQARRWDSDHDGIPDRRDPTPYGANRSKDSDHDGIPDRRDSTPYGGSPRGDRDGDGVPDRRDAQPNNPKRS